MGVGCSSVLLRSWRHSLPTCPSSRTKGERPLERPSERPVGYHEGPGGVVVVPLENPPDVIEAHERYYSRGHNASSVRYSYSPKRLPVPLPTQHLHPSPEPQPAPAPAPGRDAPMAPPRTPPSPRRQRSHHGRRHRDRPSGHRSRTPRPAKPARTSRQKRGTSRTSRSCFGYDIQDVDGFLAKASPERPANIPMVLAAACTLYHTREGGWQEEVELPLGMVVNGVFRASCWLYAQTPHGDEGYVLYSSCLPLGILPSASASTKVGPCWDTTSDIFPFPAVRAARSHADADTKARGTRSERAYNSRRSRGLLEARRAEHAVDALYLRANRADVPWPWGNGSGSATVLASA